MIWFLHNNDLTEAKKWRMSSVCGNDQCTAYMPYWASSKWAPFCESVEVGFTPGWNWGYTSPYTKDSIPVFVLGPDPESITLKPHSAKPAPLVSYSIIQPTMSSFSSTSPTFLGVFWSPSVKWNGLFRLCSPSTHIPCTCGCSVSSKMMMMIDVLRPLLCTR